MPAGLIGNYKHSLDAKGRLFLPAKLREQLSETVYMTYSVDGCVTLFSESEWERFTEALNQLEFTVGAELERYFIGNSGMSEIDGQGRITIPQNLRTHASLEKDVTVVGLGRRIELWSTPLWDEYNNAMPKANIKEALSKAGFKF